MADKIQFRRDYKEKWERHNPILLEGEIGLVLDDSNLYKMGDGERAWVNLPYRGFDGTLVSIKGESINSAMSQKGVTDGLNELDLKINNLNSSIVNKIDKTSVLTSFPSVEPTNDNELLSSKVIFNKNNEINVELSGKFNKDKIITEYPSEEPEDDTTILSFKQYFNKNKEQEERLKNVEGLSTIVNSNALSIRNGKIPTKVYVVDKNGGGDDTSFSNLLKKLKDDKDEKIIYINKGVYDIFSELGGDEYIKTLTGDEKWDEVSCIIPINTTIIGKGNVILEWTPSDDKIVNDKIANLFSPLNIVGSCCVENIEIMCSNSSYSIKIHNLDENELNDSICTFKNVRVKQFNGCYDNTNSVISVDVVVRGRYVFENCVFEGEKPNILTCRTSEYYSENDSSNLIFNNCIFNQTVTDIANNENTTIKFISWKDSFYTNVNYATLSNCYVCGKIHRVNDDGPTSKNKWKITTIGGKNNGINSDVFGEDNYPITSY